MRILFTTQSDSLTMFDALGRELANRCRVEAIGYTVADSLVYGKWLAENPEFENKSSFLLKEWEITRAPFTRPDLEKLARYEREIGGEAGLFGALIADRRLFMGKDCTYTQDYRRRFTDDELLCILQRGLERTEQLFETLKPDVVMGFICVTMLDYLAYLFAKARGIRFLNMRPTRVGDYVTVGELLNDPTPEFLNVYHGILDNGNSEAAEEARQYIRRVREKHGRYEGVVSPSAKPAIRVNPNRDSLLRSLARVLKNYSQYRRSEAFKDNHVPNPLRALLFALLVNPMRAKAAASFLKQHFIPKAELKTLNYAFYPLHTEPEVSLLVYGRPYVNQLEVIRSLAMSLPADMFIVIKEHPWMVGKRSLNSYRKLLNIPKVRIASPDMEARELIQDSALVAVITGSVALEAAMLGKPVLTFGDCPYNALPGTMVQRCSDLRRLQSTIRMLLSDYKADDAALDAYVAAIIETSARLNLYSVLLAKKGVYTEQAGDYQDEIKKMADFLVNVLRQSDHAIPTAGAAAW